jgi:hypothetical protein
MVYAKESKITLDQSLGRVNKQEYNRNITPVLNYQSMMK